MGSCATGVLAIVVSLTALDSRANDSMNEVTNSDGRDPAVAGGRPPTSARIAAPSNQSIGIPIHEGTSRYQGLWLILEIACLAAFVDVVVASRSGLWGDEILSLAKATSTPTAVLSLALRVDNGTGHERHRTSIVFSRVLAGLSAVRGQYRTPAWRK